MLTCTADWILARPMTAHVISSSCLPWLSKLVIMSGRFRVAGMMDRLNGGAPPALTDGTSHACIQPVPQVALNIITGPVCTTHCCCHTSLGQDL